MIVVDTSAVIAILLREPTASSLARYLAGRDDFLISAGTLAELRIVAAGRGVSAELEELLTRIKPQVATVTDETVKNFGQIYRAFGKGFHPAGLNFGDCFAYELTKERHCPLLFVGNDFSRTDIESAIPAA